MKTKGWLLIAASLVIMLGTVLGLRLYQRYERAAKADRLFEAGEYEAARDLYVRVGNEEAAARCEAGIRRERIREAGAVLQTGDYERAQALLEGLEGEPETAELLRGCDFLRAGALARGGKPEEAKALYLALGEYPGCGEALEALTPALYERALELAYAFEMESACGIWRDLGDYRDSAALLKRGERILSQLGDGFRTKLNDPSRRMDNPLWPETYVCDEAYILFPEKPDAGTRFFLYFPGGRDEEIYEEFLFSYMENPAPNTLAVFLRRNGLPDMEGKCRAAMKLLETAAADCGVFAHDVLVAGSSLGAYPAMQCPRVAVREYLISVPCVLSLDAGNEWNEPTLVPNREQCLELAGLGTQFYLFQPTWVDMSYEPIRLMVETGNWVMLAGCLHDEHEQISYDVLGTGVIDWALGDRSGHCPGEIYTFRRLTAGN